MKPFFVSGTADRVPTMLEEQLRSLIQTCDASSRPMRIEIPSSDVVHENAAASRLSHPLESRFEVQDHRGRLMAYLLTTCH